MSLLLFFSPLSLSRHFLSLVSLSPSHECELTVSSWVTSRHYNLPGMLPNNHTPLTESLFVSQGFQHTDTH